MSESFSALGFFVHKPCGPRKSAIPDSVEMPAPVSTTIRRDSSTHSQALSSSWPIEVFYKTTLMLTARRLSRRQKLQDGMLGGLRLIGGEDVTGTGEHNQLRSGNRLGNQLSVAGRH